jgi:hypothetical protein
METEYGDAGGQPLPPGPAMKRYVARQTTVANKLTACRAQEDRAGHSTGPRGRRNRGRGGRGGGSGGGDSSRWEDERTVPRRDWGADRSIGRDEFGRDIVSDRSASPPPARGRFDRPERGKRADAQPYPPFTPRNTERSPERLRSFAPEPPLDPVRRLLSKTIIYNHTFSL